MYFYWGIWGDEWCGCVQYWKLIRPFELKSKYTWYESDNVSNCTMFNIAIILVTHWWYTCVSRFYTFKIAKILQEMFLQKERFQWQQNLFCDKCILLDLGIHVPNHRQPFATFSISQSFSLALEKKTNFFKTNCPCET